MEAPTFKIIKTTDQYNSYCILLDILHLQKKKTRDEQDTIELLTLLTDTFVSKYNSPVTTDDPVRLLRQIMVKNNLKAGDLAGMLDLSRSLIYDILNYRRRLSLNVICKLSDRFKIPKEMLSKPYKLKT